MLLIDMNQVLILNVMQQINHNPKTKLDENLIRHMVLNSIRSYVKKFKNKYGDVIICCDSKSYWRRDVFPFYKANRKQDREKSGFDWPLIFDTLNKIKEELKQYFPYKIIEVNGAEADDIIAVLTSKYSPHEKILILSSDKDFVQLQKYKNVTQYSPMLKKYISIDNPQKYIKEHIIKGDRGDGIPNFLSPDNTFVTGDRQKQIRKDKLEKWVNLNPNEFCINENMLRGYKRNEMLINLDYVPNNIQSNILTEFENYKTKNKSNMLNYFIEKKLKNLIEVIDEF